MAKQLNKKKTVSLKIENSDLEQIEELAKSQKVTISEICRIAIVEFLQKDKKDEMPELLNQLEIRLSDRIGNHKKDVKDVLVNLNSGFKLILSKIEK